MSLFRRLKSRVDNCKFITAEKNFFFSLIWKTLVLILVLWGFIFVSVRIINFKEKMSDIRYKTIKFEYTDKKIIDSIHPNRILDLKSKKIIYLDRKGNKILSSDLFSDLDFYEFGDVFFFPLSMEMGIEIKNKIYTKSIFEGFLSTFHIFLLFTPIFILWGTIIFVSYSKLKSEETIYKISKAENVAGHQSLTILTENLHHELNTPLTIIEGKMKKLERNLLEIINKAYNKNFSSFKDLNKCKNCKRHKDIRTYII